MTRAVELEDTSFISDGAEGCFFLPSHSAEKNAELLVHKFEAYSAINCFDLFTSEGAEKVAQAYEASSPATPLPPQGAVGEHVHRTSSCITSKWRSPSTKWRT